MNLKVMAAIAGIAFGIWPLIMNRSGMKGIPASVIFAACAVICLLPFSFGEWGQAVKAKWGLVIVAGIIGAAGLYFFNGMLGKAPLADLAVLFTIMIVTQIVVPSLYDCFISGKLQSTKLLGFGTAILTAWLLNKK